MTNFPTSLDTVTQLPTAATLAAENLDTYPHSTLHGNADSALIALETKVGIDGSADATSLDFKVANKQPLDPDLTTISGLTATTNNFMVASGSAWASRTPTQAIAHLGLDADLATFALPASTTISTYGSTLVDDVDAATARTTLGLGTAATQASTAFDASGAASTAQAAAIAASQGRLTPTAVKTANYTAAVGDLVACDTNTTGAFTVTLPTAPADGSVIAISLVKQASTNAVTVAAGGSDVFDVAAGSTSATVALLFQVETFQYKSASSIWYRLSGRLGRSQLDARYAQLSNNLSDVTASTARTNLGLGTIATLSSTAGGDLTGTWPSPTIASSAVTLAKMANLADQRILGNNTGGSAAPVALTGANAMAVLSGQAGATFSFNSQAVSGVGALTATSTVTLGSSGQMTVDASGNAATSGAATGFMAAALFGDGSDGVINFDGTTTVLGLVPSSKVYTLTRDIYLDTGSQLSGSGTIIAAAGFRVYCKGTLTIASTCIIRNDGNAASGATAGANYAVGTLGLALGAGGNGGSAGNGTAATQVTLSIAVNSGASTANAKGGATSAGTGNGVTAAVNTQCAAANGTVRNLQQAITVCSYNSGTGFKGGNGGNGGDGSGSGGGGGGGGGIVWVAARKLVNSGSITANGGAGANGVSGNSGGGGGGMGGAAIVIYGATGSTIGTVTAAHGNGGSAVGSGGAGAAGTDGNTYLHAI